MPTTRPYPVEHYPKSFFEALKKAAREKDIWHTAATAPTSKEAASLHRKLQAMLRGFQVFQGQDRLVEELVAQGRFQVRKRWDWKVQVVFLEVCTIMRPSEAAAAFLEQLKQNQESS